MDKAHLARLESLDWRWLRDFAVVAERGSLSAVARELGVGQSTITRHLHELEETVGVPLLSRSLAMVECQVEEIIERHSHGIIVGRLASMELSHRLSGLTYWNGQYVQIDHEADLDLLAEVSIPLAHVR